MAQTPFQPPPGLTNEDTVFSVPGRWANGSLARFYQGNWQVKGGWERSTLDNLGGVCRAVLAWTDTTNILDIAFGCHNALKLWQGGMLFDITPQYSRSGAAPNWGVSTFVGSASVGVREADFPRRYVGEVVTISGAPNPLGGVNVNGVHTVSSIDPGQPDVWYFINSATASADATSGVTVVTFTSNIPPGQIDGTGGAGYGTGAYGIGTYGTPSTVEYFPRTWSLSNWGGDLIANPRGGKIYQWQQSTLVRAIVLPGAPVQVTYALTTPQRQVMAMGCNEEVSGVFNPLCIRWSDIEDNTDWVSTAANNAGEWILESGGRIVCGRIVGDYAFCWTADGLFMGTFVGAPGQTWKFERIGSHCGSISPGAPIVASQNVAWISPDRVHWTCSLGGAPKPLDCPIRAMFAEHITPGQDDKIVGGTTSTFSELTWCWPDERDGFECSRLLSVCPDGWSRDLLARSAFVDAGPQPYPVAAAPTGEVYWQEKGNSADGQTLTGFLESTDVYLSEAEGGMLVNGVYPDFRGQQGVMSLTVNTREFPQSPQRAHGPWSLAPGQAKRCFRFSGRIARVRWDWSSAPVFARGGKAEFDTEPIGGRG